MRTGRMRVRFGSLALGVPLLISTGCGGDDDGNAGDGECGIHEECDAGDGDGIGSPGFDDPEGGMVLFEWINLGDTLAAALQLPDGEKTAIRVIAHFVNEMDPAAFPVPPPGQCANLFAGNMWPMAQADTTSYLDVGEVTVTGKNDDGEDVTIEVPRSENELDNIGRAHDVFYENITPGAPNFIKPDSTFTVNVSGAGDIAAHSYPQSLFVGKHFDLENPGLNDDVTMVAGEDYTVGWQEVEQQNAPTGPAVIDLVSLVDPATGSPVIFCPNLDTDGEFTIPGEMIQSYRDTVQAQGGNPDNVILLRNLTTHALEWAKNGTNSEPDPENLRRMDMLGVYCYVQLGTTSER